MFDKERAKNLVRAQEIKTINKKEHVLRLPALNWLPRSIRRQWNRGPENMVGVVAPFGLDQPRRIAAIACRRTRRIVSPQQVGIAAGKCCRERLAGLAGPFDTPL